MTGLGVTPSTSAADFASLYLSNRALCPLGHGGHSLVARGLYALQVASYSLPACAYISTSVALDFYSTFLTTNSLFDFGCSSNPGSSDFPLLVPRRTKPRRRIAKLASPRTGATPRTLLRAAYLLFAWKISQDGASPAEIRPRPLSGFVGPDFFSLVAAGALLTFSVWLISLQVMDLVASHVGLEQVIDHRTTQNSGTDKGCLTTDTPLSPWQEPLNDTSAKNARSYPPLDEASSRGAQLLREFFAPHNERLCRLLGNAAFAEPWAQAKSP